MPEMDSLRGDLRRYHEDNQRDRARDRETFSKAMEEQREIFRESLDKQADAFQAAIDKLFLEIREMDKKVLQGELQLKFVMGDGSPGQGRLGKLEDMVETIKKFRWQVIAVVSFVLLLADRLGPALKTIFAHN